MIRFATLAILVLLFAAPSPAAGGFRKVREIQGMTEYHLESNGLTVLLRPDASLPVVTFMVTYRIGSRNESYGTTGATHLLEHMMFKGTREHNKEAGTGYDQLLDVTGAETNATTWLDRTNYHATIPPRELPLIIRLEADRMRNLRLREEDLRPEMTVVRNEFQIAANDPGMALETEIWATAYLAHPYRHGVLGWQSDVENIPMAKLRGFYDTFYWPDNATVSIIGDFDPPAALELIREHYGKISRSPVPMPRVYTEEPVQTGARRLVIRRPGDLGRIMIAFKIPPSAHPDCAALAVLCEILADGLQCRFYREVTEQGLTNDVEAFPEFARDGSLLLFSAELGAEATHQEAEDAILRVLREVKEKGVSEEERTSGIARLITKSVFTRDGPPAISEALTEFIGSGDWTRYFTWDDEVAAVTAADIQRAANRWLREDQSTTGWYVPGDPPALDRVEPEPRATGPIQPEVAATAEACLSTALRFVPPAGASGQRIGPKIIRSRAGQVDVLVCPVGVKDIVNVYGSIPLGDPANPVLADFMVAMLELGTRDREAGEIAELLDQSGATIEFASGNGQLIFAASCRKADLGMVLDLLSEQLRLPTFPRDEVDFMREQLLAGELLTRSDTVAQAEIAFSRAAFPAGHPRHRLDDAGINDALRGIRRKDLIEYHRRWVGPSAAVLAITGDVDPAGAHALAAKAFGHWKGGEVPSRSPAITPLEQAVVRHLEIGGKENTTVWIGQPLGLDGRDPEALALLLATRTLGEGFTSRLVGSVRDTDGLTYSIGADMECGLTNGGVWRIEASFAPDKLARGLESIRAEVREWHDKGISEVELEYRKRAMAGRHQVLLSSSASLAIVLHDIVRDGRDPSWIDGFPQAVAALTLEQVNQALRKHIRPDRLITITAGTTAR